MNIRSTQWWAASAGVAAVIGGSFLSIPQQSVAVNGPGAPFFVQPPTDHGIQFTRPQLAALDAQTSSYVNAGTARSQFAVDGTGLAVAVLDTGLRITHNDFSGKVPARRNFTTDDGGDVNNVNDGDGHGTNVAGITAARGVNTGIAPGANVIPLKVLRNDGGGSFAWVASALDWVIANASTHNIGVVNMSLGDGGNYTNDNFSNDAVRTKIQQLRSMRIAVVVAAGNDFYGFNSAQGMGYPAVIRECVSVGAQYDTNIGPVTYGDGASATTTAAGVITPFSQRLHPNVNASTRTDIFVPGAALTSSGIANDTASSTFHGTSQAAPVTSGLVLLAQEYARRRTGQLPTVDQLENWLRASSSVTDGDDENDNVTNTNLQFVRGDALALLTAAKNEIDAGGGGGGTPPTPPPPTTSNVTVTFATGNSTLSLTGDSGANLVTISRSGNRVVVTAGNGTRVNGTTSVGYTVSNWTRFNISANLGAGNDEIGIAPLQANNVGLILGDGNDRAVINKCTIASLSVNGGAGTDTLTTTGSTIRRRSVTAVP